MFKDMNKKEREQLNSLIKIHLTVNDTSKVSIETESQYILPTRLTYFLYEDGKSNATVIEADYIRFVFEHLISKMYHGELFKFNAIMSKLVLKATKNTSIIKILWESHLEMVKTKESGAKAIKEREAKAKAEAPTDA